MEDVTLELENNTLPMQATCRDIIRHIPIFSGLGENTIGEIIHFSNVRKYKKNKLLFLSGDNADYLYVIISGWVKTYRETRDGHEHIIRLATSGDVFGKAAVLRHNVYNYSAMCETPVTVILVPSSKIWRMSEDRDRFPDLSRKLLRAYFDYINQLELQVEHLIYLNARQRVGCFFLKKCCGKTEGSATFGIPLKKSLIAESLSMSKETFSRCLNQLQATGVDVKGNIVTVRNIAQLRSEVCVHCSALKEECIMGVRNR